MEAPQLRKFLHDLNNALNAAKINSFLLRRESLTANQKESLAGIDAALDKARDIIATMNEHTDANANK
jgi:hypothetical protein